MFDEIRERIWNIITSRFTILALLFLGLGGILVYRCFDLQIIQGQQYLDEFILQTEKTRDIPSTRGRILDRNGKVLAYNELAYFVNLEDVYESGKSKNKNMNATIYKLIDIIEGNGDHVITDFDIVLNQDGEFEYNVEGTSLLRFLADVFGHTKIEDLDEDTEKNATPDEVIEFLGGTKKFAIGDYEEKGNSKSKFIVGKGYTKEELLKMVTIRYAMNLTSFRKYIGTTVAKDVSEKTVAVIMENSDELAGVTIVPDTMRKYEASEYFAHVLGYTGRISSEELKNLNEAEALESGNEERYSLNDVVGKSGIEAYMESTLQGYKGYEKVSVDNMGKVISVLDRTEAISGDDLYLTLDYDLQIAAYEILEQKIAGLLLDKIVNTREYNSTGSSSDIKIPIYDVYFAVINNSVVDIRHFVEEDAGETEKAVYGKYLQFKEKTYERLRAELTETRTPYNKLSKEYQVYESNIVSLLNRNGVIVSEKVDAEDATQIAWAKDEVISLNEYLNYCIAQNWIDVTKLELDEKYPDSGEIYSRLVDYIIDMVDGNLELQKRFYRYMLLGDVISGKDICMLLCEQNAIEVPADEEEKLYSGSLSAYSFMTNRIRDLDITPAQLALDPCNGSVVITDVRTGKVLAMVSYPGYDNNKMANSVDADYYARLIVDKSAPSLNYATQYKAAPGSTFKMVSATAALMEGITDLRSQITCTGAYTTVTPPPHCWRRSGHGPENLSGAIRDSCNFYFYEMGYRLSTRNGSFNEEEGLGTLAKYADMYGLSEKSGVEIAEYPPDVSDELPIHSAIGQGTNSFTTVGLARYITAVANSGTCFNLSLLDKVADSDGNVLEEFAPDVRNIVEMPQEYWNAIHTGMRQVIENKAYFKDLTVSVAGKTGTAQQTTSRPNHALFVCYAPYENPEIAISTRIPFGYASDYAAQVTRDIIKYYYDLAPEEELITGTADTPDAGVVNNEF